MHKTINNRNIRMPRATLVFAVAFAIATGIATIGDLHAQPPSGGDTEIPSTRSFESGYIFVGEQYIAPPYRLEVSDSVLRINGTEFDEAAFDMSAYAPRGQGGRGPGDRGMGGRGQGGRGQRSRGDGVRREGPFGDGGRGGGARGPRGDRSNTPLQQVYRSMEALTNGAVVLLATNREPEFLYSNNRGHDFLEFLLKTTDSNKPVELPELAGDESDREHWRQIAAAFHPTPEFLKRAKHQIDELNGLRDGVDAQNAALKLSRRINYPLTMFALVLVVFAVGHLMTIAQPTFSDSPGSESTEKTRRLATRSLVIIALLSAIDLVWTILAHKSGSMRELNPIGGRMISDPFQLLVFKVSLTGFAIILLFRLRQLPLTRKATWWCCLVLTLLTVRWLTFQSLFA